MRNSSIAFVCTFALIASGCGRESADAIEPLESTPPESAVATDETPTEQVAVAELAPTEDHRAAGTVTFVLVGDRMQVSGSLSGLEPGKHAVHVHETGDCSAPDASSAGGHFTPDEDPHGAPSDPAGQHHAGDLGNVEADDEGRATFRKLDSELRFSGDYSVVGRAVVVHRGADDLTSQPSGDAGVRVACGVIEAATVGG